MGQDEKKRKPEHEGSNQSEHAGNIEATSDFEALQKQVDEEKTKSEEYLKHWQRTQADFINYKRRMEQERVDQIKYANSSLILKVLPVLDDFDRAFANIPSEFRQAPWLEGITLIERKLRQILEQEGVVPIEALGKDFDPAQHEAVLFDDGADPKHSKVVAELQKGYKLHDRVIRPTMVKVGPMPAETSEDK
jgi:molecular chaperone GrpE